MNRVLMVHQGAELYGSDRSFLSIAKYFDETYTGDIEVILPEKGELSESFNKSGIHPTYHGLGILRKKDVKKIFRFLLDSIKSVFFYRSKYKSFDIVYINTVVMFSALIAAALTKNKRVICHVREIPVGKQMFVFKLLLKLSRAHLIFNSEATKNAFGFKGDVIYNGVEAPSNPTEIPSTIKASKINFLIIGRVNDWKGQDLLLESIAKLTPEVRSKIKVRVVGGTFGGNNTVLTHLFKLIEENNLKEVVQFHNFSNDPSEHYDWAHWVVVPSKKPEPFGRVAVESFAFGKPVIAANHGGLREIVTDKKNGFLFEPNSISSLMNIINLVLHMPSDEYSRLAEASKNEYLNRFSEQSYQQHLYNLILVK
ncbi:glycosyltransferase family 4 protein [Pseudoalteromonas sp. UCD-33C]|uniref:glycosyltransferase family 4 protein n=1 Tax=Pseudoalteromonas sp. UCD-33C TaxID=1716175 RepID=UPI0006C9F3E1|nr:glycosyltransferase family 4 protein [Pseudoalteromonas sp. UCD-33C]KPM75460.1 hypothetical protein AOG26_16865 [Pseudoalteromonas sp. UCD-33C]